MMAIAEEISRRGTNLTNEVDFTSVVEEFHCPLFRFAVFLVRSESDAADLVQQTFLKLAQNSHQIRDFSQIKCWLFTTLRREFLRTVRLRKKHLETEFITDIHDPPTRESEPWRSLDARIVLDALSRIDVKYRTIVELFYLSELSYKEIAETLKIPIGTVMSRLSRGKEQLKSIVAKYIY
jgi:RNA polymerase sigma factor (sigma-70 family)